ncbi:hypothetical protein CCR75_003640 [Bremia lactucae]|uniref:Leishmanolysin-like peptidase n=1 Tax=Bremia lactucae TaxID=4779 RepID=A0A976NZF5_BRELC|nr:hypothetical protein CCR75_003640 [Bremia lactucae]
MVLLSLFHGCLHDSIDHQLPEEDLTTFQTFESTPFRNHSRPVQITPYYDETAFQLLSQEKRAMLYRIIPEAIRRFQAALQYKGTKRPTNVQGPMDDVSSHLLNAVSLESVSIWKLRAKRIRPSLLYIRAASTSYCTNCILVYTSSSVRLIHFQDANFCPSQISASLENFQAQVSTTMHEMTHALGFSSPFFSYSDGTPRTSRDSQGRPPIFETGTCPNNSTIDYYVELSTYTIQNFQERGHVVAKMVTPKVAAFVKAHFGCHTLEGAEIEQQDNSGCLGTHWEERIFESEYMASRFNVGVFLKVPDGIVPILLECILENSVDVILRTENVFFPKREIKWHLITFVRITMKKAAHFDQFAPFRQAE